MVAIAKCEIKHEASSQDANNAQCKAKSVFAIEAATECFILHMARARPCFNCFKELTHQFIKFTHFKYYIYTHSSTLSSMVWLFWTISYANASVSRLILAEFTWIHHLVSLFTFLALIFALILPCIILYI